MLALNYLKQFLRDVRSQKLRFAMTVFGIVWGTAAVTLMLAFGEGFHRQMRTQALGLGENIVICWPMQTSKPWQGLPRGRRIRVSEDDLDLIRREVPQIAALSGEYSNNDWTAKVGRKAIVPDVVGTNPVFAVMRNLIPSESGRFINPLDMRDRKRVVFLGDELAEELFGDQEPVGKYVYVGGVPFLVVGVMQHKAQSSNYSGPDAGKATIPATTYRAMHGDRYVDNFIFQVDDPGDVDRAADKVLSILARRYQFDPTDREAVMMWDVTEMMAFFNAFFLTFRAVLAIIGSLTLVVGGIGVSNIMNVVVEERSFEVGLKMALGARRRLVLGQFLLETFFITLIGGAVGFLISWAICGVFPSLGLREMVGDPRISAQVGLGTIAVLGLISLVAGYFPARTAAHLNPVEALKL